MTISDEAVEAAASAAYESVRSRMQFPTGYGEAPEGIRAIYATIARAALEAAAPFIRAEALEEAADDVDLPGSSASGYYASEQDSGYREAERHVEAWLRNRAYAEMRQG